MMEWIGPDKSSSSLKETVMSFLKSLSDAHRPKVMSDIELLQNLKRRHTKSLDATFKPWDKLFYGQYVAPQIGGNESLSGSSDPFHKNHHCSSSSSSEHDSQEMLIARHFTLGKTMEGLNRIFRSVYGITLEPGDVKNGEVWHSDVCKLNVVHETLGKIGIIYCDLFARNHDHGRKYDSPAHFTVRCSRRIDTDYEEQLVNHHNTMDFSSTSSSVPHDSYLLSIPSLLNPEAEIEVSDENNTATRFNKRYQIPIVVLVTGLNKSFDRPCYLTLSEVQTLFHEMGHAMHCKL